MENQHPNASQSASHKRIYVLFVVIVSVGAIWGSVVYWDLLSSDEEPAPVEENPSTQSLTPYRPPSESGYVGSSACADCHADISDSYAAHPMALSTLAIEKNRWAESECRFASIPGTKRLLTVSCENDQLVHHEQMFDDEGEMIYDQPFQMEYVVGSGQRAKAYLHQQGDLLLMSPLNWYRQSERWDLAPNYQPDDIRRFRRRVTDACLSCHAGRMVVDQRNSNRYPEPVFHEIRIGCERCHGPGREHIEFHENASTTAGATDPIVNPAKLDHTRRESVCYQCHLSSAARLLRPGRSHLDFRPGMALSDIWAVIDAGSQVTRDGRTRSVNHVSQMRDSRCYLESAGEMGCITCHDPHQVPAADSRITYYREKCLNCHADRGCSLPHQQRELKQNDCTACHMPRLDSSNISHVAQTDHRILRTPGQLDPNDSPRPVAALRLFAEMGEELPPAERLRAMAAGTFIYHTNKKIPLPAGLRQDLERALKEFPDDYLLLTILGDLRRRRNEIAAARSYFQKACEVTESHEEALDNLLELSYETADWNKVIECARELIEIDPTDAGTHAMLGDALINRGRVEEGIESVERAAELNPGALPLHEWLLQQYQRQGLTDLAEAKRKQIERIRSARIPDRIKSFTPGR
jgi:Flp pilus assembly protein TadD